MPELAPDTCTRVALTELSGVTLSGGPATARVESARSGEVNEWDIAGAADFPATACPDLVTVTWEVSGVAVSATVDLVATRYCTLDQIRTYRADEYLSVNASDEDLWNARAWAEEQIEEAAHRIFQPVVRECFVDRPNCTTVVLPMMGGFFAHDIIDVLSATDQDGNAVDVRRHSDVQLDVRRMRAQTAANAVLLLGMRPTPAAMSGAVVALAAWRLLPSVAPDNATSATVGDNFMHFVVGGVNGAATSLPEVNAFIDRYGFKDYFVR